MMLVVIRCDGSTVIGSGHAIRCLTLARKLRSSGARVIFLSRENDGDLIGYIRRDFEVLSLPRLPQGGEGKANEVSTFGQWLGCGQEEDAEDCIRILNSKGITSVDWIVVDHYGIEIDWEERMLRGLRGIAKPKLLAIDDLANRRHQADILLDQNYHGAIGEKRYKGLVPPKCRLLAGPRYALLSHEYAHLRRLIPRRTEIRRILIFFGGSDPADLTTRTLKALMDPELRDIAVDVVIGSQCRSRKKIESVVAERKYTSLYRSIPTLAGLIARADLAIGACGSTSWERLCLKLPSIVITFGEDQELVAKPLSREGFIQHIGNEIEVDVDAIRAAIRQHIDNGHDSLDLADITDGFGTDRIAMAMLGRKDVVRLRRSSWEDEGILLQWANNHMVRSNSFTPKDITPADHRFWFKQMLERSDRLQFIAETSCGVPVGQIRFDKLDDLGLDTNEARIDLSIDTCVRGQNMSSDLVQLGIQEMRKIWGENIKVIAEVFDDNHPSNGCFRKAGFALVSKSMVKGSARSLNTWLL